MRSPLLALVLGLFTAIAAHADDGAEALFSRSYPDIQGKPTAVANWRGKPLIVNFWATWCQPCREEMPELNKAGRQHAGKLAIIGLALEDERDVVGKFVRAQKIAYPVLLAGTEAIGPMRALGNGKGALPFTVAIDRAGKVVDSHLGRLTAARLAEMIKRAED